MMHLEGRQAVFAALQARQRRFQVILLRAGMKLEPLTDLLRLAEDCGVPIRHADRSELEAVAHGATHGGVIAICGPKPRSSPATLLDTLDRLRTPPLLLLLEGIDDARNLGFTLRTADALGVHAVLVKKHLWDFDEAEVARPSSGAYERIPLVQLDGPDLLHDLRRRRIRMFGCLANARRSLHQADLTTGVTLAVGGEKRGLSGATRELCDGFLTIPTRGGPSSLALSHAAAIVLAEAARQRQSRVESRDLDS